MIATNAAELRDAQVTVEALATVLQHRYRDDVNAAHAARVAEQLRNLAAPAPKREDEDAPPTLVRQEDAWGCMVAAIAMVLGKDYAATRALLHPWFFTKEFRGIGQTEMDSILAEHGYAVARRFEHYHPACCHREIWPPAPWADVHIAEVATSMSHAVVMLRDGRVLDPYSGERESLAVYSRVLWVASVTRVAPVLPDFVGPNTANRKPPRVCMCKDAWSDSAALSARPATGGAEPS